MNKFLLYVLFYSMILNIIACADSGKDKVIDEDSVVMDDEDTAVAQQLSLIDDCNNRFFDDPPVNSDSSALQLRLKNGHSVSWNQFVKDELISNRVKKTLKTIDNDTIPELVVLNNTGGAHCCQEIYVFTKQGNEYHQKGKLFGGFLCIDPQTNIFTFSFTESLGYFFSCYSCFYRDSSSNYHPLREIELRFHNDRFAVVPYNADMDKQVHANLATLREKGYVEVDGGLMDNGWRKEYAMNLAVWHFNHGQNWEATEKLFDQYYPFKDRQKVWGEFYKMMKDAQRENTF